MVNPHVRDKSSINVHVSSNIQGRFYIISLPSRLIHFQTVVVHIERCQGVTLLGSEAHMRDPGDWCSNVTSPVDWLHNSINPFLHRAWAPHLVNDYYENPFFQLHCEARLLCVKNSETFLGKKNAVDLPVHLSNTLILRYNQIKVILTHRLSGAIHWKWNQPFALQLFYLPISASESLVLLSVLLLLHSSASKLCKHCPP